MDYDVVIVGAGLVGSSLAIALSDLPIRIALIEANPQAMQVEPNPDSRPLALTYGSSRILETIGLWPILQKQATPIASVHISDRGHFGFTRIHAKEEQVPALGYVIPASILVAEINQCLLSKNTQNLTLIHPAKVENLEFKDPDWQITVKSASTIQTLQAKLVIAADGTYSTIRQLLNIETVSQEHDQAALATIVTLAKPHKQIAYERFTENGALAMLPLPGLRYGCVWTAPKAQIETLATLSDNDFLAELQHYFGYRLGRFLAMTKRQTHPLNKLYAKQPIQSGLALIGNAAHTLHPIAAQGLNLGLREVGALTEMIVKAIKTGQSPGDLALLQAFTKNCQQSIAWTMSFTDKLTHLFAHDFFPLAFARNSGLLTLDFLPLLKHRLAKRLMGINAST